MKDRIFIIIALIFSLLFGFGFWYLILWFFTNEANLFLWDWFIKLVFLFFGITSAGHLAQFLLEEIDL